MCPWARLQNRISPSCWSRPGRVRAGDKEFVWKVGEGEPGEGLEGGPLLGRARLGIPVWVPGQEERKIGWARLQDDLWAQVGPVSAEICHTSEAQGLGASQTAWVAMPASAICWPVTLSRLLGVCLRFLVCEVGRKTCCSWRGKWICMCKVFSGPVMFNEWLFLTGDRQCPVWPLLWVYRAPKVALVSLGLARGRL